MSKYVDALLQFIIGRGDAYALQQMNGSYRTVRRPLTARLLEEHVAGRMTLGSYLVTPDGKARCGIYDFDYKTDTVREAIIWLVGWFRHWKIELCIESSGSKGYHCWVVTKQFMPASQLIKLLRLAWTQLLEKTALAPRAEIFPKQHKVEDLGNLIKLPWGIHRKTGNRAVFLDTSFMPLPDWGVSLIQDLPVIEEAAIDEILSEYPEDEGQSPKDRVGHTQNEIVEMLNVPLKVGERRPTLVKLAGYLRYRGVPEAVAVALLLPWAESQFSEPLSKSEIEQNIRGIYRRYGVREDKVAKILSSNALATILPKFKTKRRSNGKKTSKDNSPR